MDLFAGEGNSATLLINNPFARQPRQFRALRTTVRPAPLVSGTDVKKMVAIGGLQTSSADSEDRKQLPCLLRLPKRGRRPSTFDSAHLKPRALEAVDCSPRGSRTNVHTSTRQPTSEAIAAACLEQLSMRTTRFRSPRRLRGAARRHARLGPTRDPASLASAASGCGRCWFQLINGGRSDARSTSNQAVAALSTAGTFSPQRRSPLQRAAARGLVGRPRRPRGSTTGSCS